MAEDSDFTTETPQAELPKIDDTKDEDFSKRTNQLIALTALILGICATFASLYTGI